MKNSLLSLGLSLALFAHALGAAEPAGLVAFWDFVEEAGQPRISKAAPALALQEMQGPIERVAEGPFGQAIRLRPGQWLRIPRADLGPLNIHGKDAQVSVVAWVRRESKTAWQAIAGVWDESRKKRQYCLFLSGAKMTDFRTMTRTAARDRIHGHLSAVGGPTPGEDFCITYATSGGTVDFAGWHCLALSYDGKTIRVWRDGVLDEAEGMNPFPYPEGIFDGGAEGAEFTVGSVSVGGKPGNFFGGLIGGLAIFNRALTAEEMRALSEKPREALGQDRP